MRVRVIRTVGWASVGANAGTIEPRFDVAAFPDAATRTLRIVLSAFVSSFRKKRPVEREAAANKPLAEIGTAGRTGRDGPAVLIQVHGGATDRTPYDECVKIIRSLRAAPIWQTVFAATELGALRCVYPPKADPCSVYLHRVAIDDAGLPYRLTSQGRAPKARGA